MEPLLARLDLELVAAADIPGLVPPEETGATLEENAALKAEAVTAATGQWALADDTGLFVDALGGEPGVLSARYAGEDATYDDNNRLLLERLAGVDDPARRAAHFACAVALTRPGSAPEIVRAELPGRILSAPRGRGGFGYDPVFLLDGTDRTLAELSLAEKNEVSHRSRAVRLAVERLSEWLEAEGAGPSATGAILEPGDGRGAH
jgi:XTP/dITP diphosphohydrolase